MNHRHWNWRDYFYQAIAWLPPLGVAAMFTAAALTWHTNQESLVESTTKIHSNAMENDETIFADWYDSRTSKKHTLELKMLGAAADAWFGDVVESFPDEKDSHYFFAGANLDKHKDKADFIPHHALQAAPLLHRLKAFAETDDAAVWIPMSLDERMLPEPISQNLMQVLQFEFLDAVLSDQPPRAIDAIRLCYRVDTKINLGRSGFSMLAQTLVRNSLSQDIWSESELAILQELCSGDGDESSLWRDQITAEFLIALPILSGAGHRGKQFEKLRFGRSTPRGPEKLASVSSIAPSEVGDAAAALAQIQSTGGVGTWNHYSQVAGITSQLRHRQGKEFQLDHWLKVPFMKGAWISGLVAYQQHSAQNFLTIANTQRWTRCAIALKQFRLRFGRWPSDLSELSEVDLPASDTVDYLGDKFFYRIEDDATVAQLWCQSKTPPIVGGQFSRGTQSGLIWTDFVEIR